MSLPVAIRTSRASPPTTAKRRPRARKKSTRTSSGRVRRATPTAMPRKTRPPAQTAAPIRCSARTAVSPPLASITKVMADLGEGVHWPIAALGRGEAPALGGDRAALDAVRGGYLHCGLAVRGQLQLFRELVHLSRAH